MHAAKSKVSDKSTATSSERFLVSQKIIDIFPSLITIYNVNTSNYIFVSNSIKKILGYSKNDFITGGVPFVFSLIHPDDLQEFSAENIRAIEHANSINHNKNDTLIFTKEYRMRHKNGTWCWFLTRGVVYDRNKKGFVEHVMNISTDITKRKKREIISAKRSEKIKNKLKKNEQKFRALFEPSTDAITLLDKNGVRIYATPSRKNILGYNLHEDLGKSVFELIHPEDKPQVASLFREVALQKNKSATRVFRVLHKSGKWIWIEAVGTNLLHIPAVAAIVINYRDVTERTLAEERRQFLEKATNILISSLDYSATLKEVVNLIVPYLADYCRIVVIDKHGESQEAIINTINEKNISLVKKVYQQYKKRKDFSFGMDKVLSTGKSELVPWIESLNLKPTKNDPLLMQLVETLHIRSYMGVPLKARGKIIGAMTFSSTKENVKYTKEDLQFAQELAYRIAIALDNAQLYENEQQAVQLRDNFISITSHELKTPITVMKGFTQLLQKNVKNKEVKYCLTRLEEQINRLTGLINNLLDSSKIKSGKLELSPEKVNLNQLIMETIADIQSIRISQEIVFTNKEEIIISADRFRLSQVIINLILNASHYSDKSKKIIISTNRKDHYAEMHVQDFGSGVDTKSQRRIFEKFYRGGPIGRRHPSGLGLGLYISKEIVVSHGGDIFVQSKEGKGSIFTVRLPL